MGDHLADRLANDPSELVQVGLRVAILDDIVALAVEQCRVVEEIVGPLHFVRSGHMIKPDPR